MKATAIPELEELARMMVGDGNKHGDVFFVTDRGIVTTITTSFPIAQTAWMTLRTRYPLQECALENRTWGVIASVEPIEDGSTVLHVIDDARSFEKTMENPS